MTLALVVLFVFLLIHPLASLGALKTRPSLAEFVRVGGQERTWKTTMSLLATMLGASALLGTSGLAARHGWSALVWPGAGVLGLTLLAWLVPRVPFGESLSLPDLLGASGGKTMRLVSALVIVPAWIGIIAAQFAAAGRVAEVFAPGLYVPVVAVSALAVALYVAASGQRGVIRTDVWQLLAIVALLVALLGGPAGDHAGVIPIPDFSPLSVPAMLDILVAVGFTYLVGPDIYSRLLTVGSTSARRSVLLASAAGMGLVGLAVVAVGMWTPSVVAPGQPESILVTLPQTLWGPWGARLVGLGLLAALLSSADTCVLSASTILAVDILGVRRTAPIRLLSVVVAFLAAIIAMWLGGIIKTLLLSYTIYTGGLAIPVVFALFLKRPLGALELMVTILVGSVVAVTLSLRSVPYAMPIALAVSLGTALLMTFVTRLIRRSRVPS